jgi:hypothetical protein
LGYAGGLHYGYGEQIAAMLPVLRATKTRLEIFGPMPSGKLAGLKDATDVLAFHGYAPTPEEAWTGLLTRCDAVLLPYLNPPGEHHVQYQTHFPSKLGDMLSLGLPVVVTGPEDASGVAWCQANDLSDGVVTAERGNALAAIFTNLSEMDELRADISIRSLRAAHAFDLDAISADLNKKIRKCCLIDSTT